MRKNIKAKLILLIVCLSSMVLVSMSDKTSVQAQGTTILNGDFESGDFTGWTGGGLNGGVAGIAQEGTCLSANNTLGLTFGGDYAAGLRSSGPAPISSVGILSSDPFIAGTSIAFSALSENDDQTPAPNPVTLEVRVLDAADTLLLTQVVDHNIITLALSEPNCASGEPRNKEFSTHVIDTSAFEGQTIKVQFRQHTNVPGKGFLTFIDDVSTNGSNEPQEIAYFALGDSIASGHGLMDTGGACHKSANSYPYKVKTALEEQSFIVDFHHMACSGAVAKRLPKAKPPEKSLHNQVSAAMLEISELPVDMPVLVSITIGANDFDWASPDILTRMVSPQKSFDKWVTKVTSGVETSIAQQLAILLTRPNVVVILTELYNPFNTGSYVFALQNPKKLKNCPALDCYVRTELAISQFNAAITNQWLISPNQDRIRIAQINGVFRGHEAPQGACGLNSPTIGETWIQYLGDPNSNSTPSLPRWLVKQIGNYSTGDCFHPNELGAEAIAIEVTVDALALLGR